MDIVERLRSSAKALRENTVYDSEGDPLRLIVQADEADEAAIEITRLRAENERKDEALRVFANCAYPVCTSITKRGYNWRGENDLDYALSLARAALRDKP